MLQAEQELPHVLQLHSRLTGWSQRSPAAVAVGPPREDRRGRHGATRGWIGKAQGISTTHGVGDGGHLYDLVKC